tara:strand:+ start:4331 stop:5740 length:1410 start_codon:yes stop_codon:yes gene_type:complete
MISSRYHGLIRLHATMKIIGGMTLFWTLVWMLHMLVYGPNLLPDNYLLISLLIPMAALIEILVREKKSRSLSGMHRSKIWSVTQREILFALVTIFGVIVMGKDPSLSRFFLATFIILYALWITWMNHVGHRILQKRLFRSSERGRSNTVVVAPPREIELGTAMQMTDDLPGAKLVGHVPYGGAAAITMPGFPNLGNFEDIREICRNCNARLLLALGLDDSPDLVRTLQDLCDSLGMRLIWVEDKALRFKGRLDSHQSGSKLMLTNWHEPLEDPINRAIKRGFDLGFSGVVAITVLPFLCLSIWILHRIFSPGPLFYKQQRTGRDGEVFDMLKFRSMHMNDTPGVQATTGDPRIFPCGGFLRRSSLDEMPQFLNVLNGEMSVIGPRPHYVDHDEQFSEIIGSYPIRQFAKPGITGLAQVKGCRGETLAERQVRQRVRLDHFYLRHWSPLLDVCIVCDTALQVVAPLDSAR